MAIKKMQMYRRNLDGTETRLNPLTEAQYVSMKNGQTVQEILSDRDSDKYTPVITNSSSTFKVGQGDNVDLSSSMKEGAYDSCVLKGKTMVNCIQEPSSQDVVLPYAFEDGQYVTINDTKESGALGVKLKGQTLVNLSNPHEEREIVFNTRYQVYNVTNDVVKGGLKNGEKIFMSMEVNVHEINIETANFRVGTCRGTGGYDHIIKTNTEIHNLPKNTWVRLCTIREVNEEQSLEQYSFWFGMRGEHPTTDKEQIARVSFRNPVWINLTSMFGSGKEPTLTDCEKLPYFTGMSSCKMPILHTVGKNLFNPHLHKSLVVNSDNTITLNSSKWSENRVVYNLKPSTTYKLNLTSTKQTCWVCVMINGASTSHNLGGGALTKTITTDTTGKLELGVYANTESNIGSIVNTIQLEEGSNATTYESHKSSILSLPEEVVLRSLPNGVSDTFNTRTGVYTRYIEEVVLNGTDPITSLMTNVSDILETTSRCYLDYNKVPNNIAMKSFGNASAISDMIICNSLPTMAVVPNMQYNDIESVGQTGAGFSIRVKGKNITECKQRLTEQPVVIQYERKTPVVTKINLSSTLKSWNTTTHIYSEVPENTLYPILSHSNPSYPVILKPSTKYSIVTNSYGNGHTNSAINFNLGGATASTTVGNRVTTITTPSTLTSEELVMSGRGNKLNNVMVIEGDVVGDEPYFEGICDVKSPILSNVGKNLFNIDGDINQTYDGWYAPHKNILCDVNTILINAYSYSNKGSGQIINVRPNTNYRVWYGQTGQCRVMISDSQGNQLGAQDLYGETNYTKIDFNSANNTSVVLHFTTLGDSSVSKATIKNIFFSEHTENFVYEPYKSNILSCNGDKIELTEDMFEQGSFTGGVGANYESNKEINSNRIRVKKLLKLSKDTFYSIKCNDDYSVEIAFYDEVGVYGRYLPWTSSTVFNTGQQPYIAIKFKKKSEGAITTSDFNKTQFQLIEVDKTIVLRSLPNGVCDTLNVETGEYTQRIGEVVITENKLKGVISETLGDYTRFALQNLAKPSKQFGGVCDKIQYEANYSKESTHSYVGGSGSVYLFLLSSVASNENSLRTWLQTNPVTIQYELAEPIVSTIDVQGFPYAYKDGYVQLSSGSIEQSLTPKVEYSLSANKTGQINSNTKRVSAHQKQLDDFEAMMLTSMVQSAYDKAILQFDYEMRMMSLGGE